MATKNRTLGDRLFQGTTSGILRSDATSDPVWTTGVTANDTHLLVGANVVVNTSTVQIGNSTVNVVANSSTILRSNATDTWNIGNPQVVTQIFTANGTYTPTSGMKYATIECIGAGGGSGGVAGSVQHMFGAGGGGGGGYSRVRVTSSQVGASQTVTVGIGGANGATTPGAGSAGSNTSVGTLCLAKGGGGGGAASVGVVPYGGKGANTTSAVGDIKIGGDPGGWGVWGGAVGYTLGGGGMGGSSALGGGGWPAEYTYQNFTAGGNPTVNSGGGGGGPCASDTTATPTGIKGADGIVIITEFCW